MFIIMVLRFNLSLLLCCFLCTPWLVLTQTISQDVELMNNLVNIVTKEINEAYFRTTNLDGLSAEFLFKIPTVEKFSAAYYLNNFKGNDGTSMQVSKQPLINEGVFQAMIEANRGKNIPVGTIIAYLSQYSKINALNLLQCDASFYDNVDNQIGLFNEPPPSCLKDTSKYRSINGSCNNFLVPIWGRSFTKFRRLVPSTYDDGFNLPHLKSVTGELLPCARAVSGNVILNRIAPQVTWSHLFMQWAQFLDHDFTQTPGFVFGAEREAPLCCNEQMSQNFRGICFPISLCQDPFFTSENQTCMEFVRSLPAPNTGCGFGPREQMNRLTAYIDASNVYGSTDSAASELRELNPNTGKLRTRKVDTNPRPLLPSKKEIISLEDCLSQFSREKPEDRCDFIAGDNRVNIIPTLAVMHTLWVREHNRIVVRLQELGMQDPEILYQEARRIVGAMMQHITFNEFLPPVFGVKLKDYPQLQLLKEGYYRNYSVFTEAGISNGFATAAFRFGHTLVNGFVNLYDNSFQKVPPLDNALKNHFFRSQDMYGNDMLERYLRGAMVENAQDSDNIVTDALTKFLFKKPSQNFGLDLISLNIQRGRDHGIGTWLDYRKYCKLSVPNSFEDIISLNIMSADRVRLFQLVYRDVRDMELWPAGISEKLFDDGAIGETFGCIFAEQFTRARVGDRYWYENFIPPESGFKNGLTPEQLAEIRKSSLARIICDNTEVQEVQSLAMRNLSPRVPCSQIPSVDLKVFITGESISIPVQVTDVNGNIIPNPGEFSFPTTKQQLIDIFKGQIRK